MENQNLSPIERQRALAIRLRLQGWTLIKIAKKLNIHRVTVSRWVARYRNGGSDALKSRKAKGAARKLDWASDPSQLVRLMSGAKKSDSLVSTSGVYHHLQKQLSVSRVTVWNSLRLMWLAGGHDWELCDGYSSRNVHRTYDARYWSVTKRRGIALIRSDKNRYFIFVGLGSKTKVQAMLDSKFLMKK